MNEVKTTLLAAIVIFCDSVFLWGMLKRSLIKKSWYGPKIGDPMHYDNPSAGEKKDIVKYHASCRSIRIMFFTNFFLLEGLTFLVGYNMTNRRPEIHQWIGYVAIPSTFLFLFLGFVMAAFVKPFNRPKFLVPPYVRNKPGSIEERKNIYKIT